LLISIPDLILGGMGRGEKLSPIVMGRARNI